MANIEKIVCTWNTFVGAPGYTVMYARPGGGMQPFVKNFWAALVSYFPTGLTVSTPNTGEILDEKDGKMNGVWTNGTAGIATGTGTGPYAPQAGALVRWQTAGFANGHQIKGRTFLVPLVTSSYTTGGIMLGTVSTAIAAAANTLWSSGGGAMIVWHRPIWQKLNGVNTLVRDGVGFSITGSSCAPGIATLRSRRDV